MEIHVRHTYGRYIIDQTDRPLCGGVTEREK